MYAKIKPLLSPILNIPNSIKANSFQESSIKSKSLCLRQCYLLLLIDNRNTFASRIQQPFFDFKTYPFIQNGLTGRKFIGLNLYRFFVLIQSLESIFQATKLLYSKIKKISKHFNELFKALLFSNYFNNYEIYYKFYKYNF